VPSSASARPSPRAILATCDFSAPSRRTLELVRALHGELHASVTLVHVEDPDTRPQPGTRGYDEWSTESARRERHARLGQHLRSVADEVFGPDEQKVSVRVEVGVPAHRVVELATELGCDLIAAGSSGKGAIDRALMGSVTHELVRTATVPVLVVH
jgi:nucleotide-binding universal stress UspA family protein